MDKVYRLSIVFYLLLLLTGCWDRVEIEDRGFVLGAAIDLGGERTDSLEAAKGRTENYKVTYQVVLPGNASGKSAGSSQGSNGSTMQKPYLNLTEEGRTIFQLTREMSNKTSRALYFEHIKLYIISEEVAKRGYLFDAIDVFIRDHEMRRAAKVMIIEGEAKKALDVNPQYETLPVVFLDSISENTKKTGLFIPPTNIGDIQSYLLNETSFVIPRLIFEGSEIRISGGAIFDSKDHKMVGTINDDETKGFNLITGDLKSGVIEFLYEDQYMAYEIKSAKSKIKADVSNKEQIKFTVNIEVEGNLGESSGNVDLANLSALKKIEKKVEKELEKIVTEDLEKIKSKYETDIFGFGDVLKQNHYKTWKELEDNWDRGENYFVKSEVDFKIGVQVRQIGASTEIVD